ncbi:hypothetical protein TNCV_3554511 [Trichonephila clavipes]|nr:hypothetical protein TNCV_3554511 [Trichonephila clavipes]
MRSTMENEKLNGSMLQYTQNDIAVEIDYNEVINDLLEKNHSSFEENLRCTSTMTAPQRIRMSKSKR